MNLVPLREPISNTEDVFTIYDKRDNSILFRTDPVSNTENISLEYEGLTYYVLFNGKVLITFESLINKFKKDE